MSREKRKLPAAYWAAWIIMFVVLEVAAVLLGGGTLSNYVQEFFRIVDGDLGWTLPRWVMIGLITWITLHFLRAFKRK